MVNNSKVEAPDQIVEACADHINKLLVKKPRNVILEAPWLNLPIWNTMEDLLMQIPNLKSSSSPGEDGIDYNFLRILPQEGLEDVLWCCNTLIKGDNCNFKQQEIHISIKVES
eukprot:TRINITY_DN9716_c0_g1_i1.p1 TRINITY_DN9716_c0_g1~~TRINITY_DN9716_c0_g1_i1.p1  ORF type:complete len:113 (-),score=25.65 TRINITY_DN9716_c0_g1_i1:228-566(-)